MKKLYAYLAFAIPILSLVSCSNSKSSDSNEDIIDSVVFNLDSVSIQDSALTSIESDKKKSRTMNDTQEELNYMRNSGSWSQYEKGILPQMAQDAPEYCGKVLDRLADGKKHFVIVDKAKMQLFLYDKYGNVMKKYGIACARNYGNKRKWKDNRTNEGYFDAEGVYDSTKWLYTDDNGYTSPAKGVYGPWFIRLVHPIGIHGTSSPGSIGKRVSHGCIRVKNDDIRDLVNFVEKGTPIIVSPGPKDMAVNKREGLPTVAVVTEPGTPRATPGSYDMTQKVPVAVSDTKKADTSIVINGKELPAHEQGDERQESEIMSKESIKQTETITPTESSKPASEVQEKSE